MLQGQVILTKPDRRVHISNTVQGRGGLGSISFRTSNLRDWRRHCQSFEFLTGYQPRVGPG
jgi:hypothetical protein